METNNANNKGEALIQGSSSQQKVRDICVSNRFPAGLRVLVVDDDRTCLLILEKMLQICLYKVTKCRQAKDAVSVLRDDTNKFDIVVIDLHMPDMDGFKLLEIAGLEMNLPVVMMSSDEDHEVIKKGVLHGACDYLIKPIRMEALRMIWQHVIRKKKDTTREELPQLISLKDDKTKPCGDDDRIPANTGNNKSSKRRKTSQNDDDAPDPASTGKKRLIWTNDLHEKFVRAVNHLGPGNAVPLKILECLQQMNVHGVTREHVASHLQKYRMNLRKLDSIPQPEQEHFMRLTTNRTSIFEQSQSLDDLRFLANMPDTRQFPLPILADQQATVPLPLNGIANISSNFEDPGKQFLHFGMLEANCYPISKSSANDSPFSGALGADPWCKTPSSVSVLSLGKEYECRNKENVAPNSQSILAHDSFDKLYEAKGDATPLLIYDPSLCLQHFDQNEIFHDPLIQHGTAPLLIKHNNATEFDK